MWENDPGEECNRINDADCAEVIRQLRGELNGWFARYVDPEFDGSKEKVGGKGQLTSHSFQ